MKCQPVTIQMRCSLAPYPLAVAYENAGRYARAAACYRRASWQAGGHTFAALMESHMRRCLEKLEASR